jgi:hypothetical protein
MYENVPIPNGVRDRVNSPYDFKKATKRETLYTVSNAGIYFSNDKMGITYLA